MLTQLYVDSGADPVELTGTDLWPALLDLERLFNLYVGETVGETEDELAAARTVLDAFSRMARMFILYVEAAEQQHGGDFREFLQQQALDVFGPDGEPS